MQPAISPRHAAATIAIFMVLGPLIGLAIALAVVVPPGGRLNPGILAPATMLVYMFGGIPALLSGVAAVRWGGVDVWQRLRVAITVGVAVNVVVHSTFAGLATGALIFSSKLWDMTLTTACAVVAATVCTFATQGLVRSTSDAD